MSGSKRFSSAAVVFLVGLGVFCATSVAAPLTGSGSHIVIPNPNPGAPLSQVRALTNIVPQSGWSGTWTSPVAPQWLGSFSAIGPVPTGNTNPTSHTSPTGITLYDFTALPNGELPVGTYFRFGDVDRGSITSETYVLSAFNSAGLITAPWLDEAIGVTGTFSSSSDLPSWNFNSTNGSYTIDGATISGNPNAAFYLPNNTAITSMEVSRSTTFQNFALYAPIVPEPSTVMMLGLFGVVLLRRRIV